MQEFFAANDANYTKWAHQRILDAPIWCNSRHWRLITPSTTGRFRIKLLLELRASFKIKISRKVWVLSV